MSAVGGGDDAPRHVLRRAFSADGSPSRGDCYRRPIYGALRPALPRLPAQSFSARDSSSSSSSSDVDSSGGSSSDDDDDAAATARAPTLDFDDCSDSDEDGNSSSSSEATYLRSAARAPKRLRVSQILGYDDDAAAAAGQSPSELRFVGQHVAEDAARQSSGDETEDDDDAEVVVGDLW